MSATTFCYIRFHDIPVFFMFRKTNQKFLVANVRDIWGLCVKICGLHLSFTYVKKTQKNNYFSNCGDLYDLKFTGGVQNIGHFKFFQKCWLNDKYLRLTGTIHLFKLTGQPLLFWEMQK